MVNNIGYKEVNMKLRKTYLAYIGVGLLVLCAAGGIFAYIRGGQESDTQQHTISANITKIRNATDGKVSQNLATAVRDLCPAYSVVLFVNPAYRQTVQSCQHVRQVYLQNQKILQQTIEAHAYVATVQSLHDQVASLRGADPSKAQDAAQHLVEATSKITPPASLARQHAALVASFQASLAAWKQLGAAVQGYDQAKVDRAADAVAAANKDSHAAIVQLQTQLDTQQKAMQDSLKY
jgi:hypothetical protein